MTREHILVFGGTGFFGRYLVEDVLDHTSASVTVASRRPRSWMRGAPGIDFAECDVADLDTVRRLAAAHDVVVHCAGPFQHLPLNPLTAAIETQCDYIDLSESREFYRRVTGMRDRIQRAGITALTGVSIVPAMQILLVDLVRPLFDHMSAIRTFLAPGTYRNRGPAMYHTMLMGVGTPFPALRGGKETLVQGWSGGEWASFPPPVGRRRTYHVLDWADSDVLASHFGVETVECKAGSEFAWVNRTLYAAGLVRARFGHPIWERWTAPLRAAAWVLGRVGRDDGGVLIEITGLYGRRLVTHRIAVVASEHGGRIPAVLGAMAAEDIVAGTLRHRGLTPVGAWLAPREFVNRLRERGMQVLWQPFDTDRWTEDLQM